MFAFAGFWGDVERHDAGEKVRTYTILTTDPNELLEPIHDRMPLIVPTRADHA